MTPLPPPAAQPQPASHSQRKRRAPGRLARCAPPGPHSNASRLRAAACLFQTNRGGDRVAPTSICDLSRRRPQSYRVGALGSPARRVLAEPGRRKAAPPRLDSASQVSVRRPLCRLRLGKLWFAVWAAGRRARRARPGAPRPLCTASSASRPWEPHQPRAPRPAPIQCPRVSGACPETQPCHRGLCGGSSLDPAGMRVLPASLPRRAGEPRRPAVAAGCLGECGSAPGPSGARSAAGACGPEARTWARLRRCLGRRGCGRCRLSAEGELGAAELLAATGFTNGSRTGAGSWDSAPLGRVQLWHQNLGIPYQRAGVQRCTCPRMEALASLLGHTIS